MKPPSRIAVLLAAALALCAFNVALVWRALERQLENTDTSRHSRARGPRDRRPRRQPPTAPPPSTYNSTLDVDDVDPEKWHAYRILRDAGISPITPEIIARLPRWSDIVSQFGPEPILNLDSCAAYRSSVPPHDRMAAVAGLFNTGTNLLAHLMADNCQIDRGLNGTGTGMRMQVPWGKHNPPATHRLKNVAKQGAKGVNQTAVFPLVLIKDPYHWANSQCRHRYFRWAHDPAHCPNIVDWQSHKPAKANVGYALGSVWYTSLVKLWNDWYNEYERQGAHFPLAHLRYEDLLFHAEDTVTQLCDCVGGRRRGRGRRRDDDKFRYPKESVKLGLKGHKGGTSGLLDAIIRYGDPNMRLEGWTQRDWQYTADNLDRGLMDKYGYSMAASPANP